MTEKTDTRLNRFKRRLMEKIGQSYFVRVHMFIILSATVLSGVVFSKILVLLGLHRMSLRYGIAIVLSYLMFFLFIKLWLLYIGVGRNAGGENTNQEKGSWMPDILPLPGGSVSGAGGAAGNTVADAAGDAGVFDGLKGGMSGGGGAVRSFSAGASPLAGVTDAGADAGAVADTAGKAGDSAGGILDSVGDSSLTVMAIVLLIALILSVFVIGGYLIWTAPALLSNAAFQAILVAGVARKVKQAEESNWETTIFKATWWGFLLVLILSIAFGIVAQMVFPDAVTVRDVLHSIFETLKKEHILFF